MTVISRALAIEDVFMFVMDDMTLQIEAISQHNPASAAAVPETPLPEAELAAGADAKTWRPDASVRVPATRLDELMDRVGELVIAQSRLKQIAGASIR